MEAEHDLSNICPSSSLEGLLAKLSLTVRFIDRRQHVAPTPERRVSVLSNRDANWLTPLASFANGM